MWKLSRRQTVLISVILIICLALFLLIRSLNSPAEGKITNSPSSQTNEAKQPSNPGQYQGKYFSFTYPAHYDRIKTPLSGGVLEAVDYYSNNSTSKHIAIGVVQESLTNDSGYNYRLTHTEIYKQTSRNGTLIFYSDKTGPESGSERTAFIAHNDLVASIALSCPFTTDLTKDFQVILDSFQWK